MDLSFEETTEGSIAVSVAGVCRDCFAGQDVDPLEQLAIAQVYRQNIMISLEAVNMLNSSGIAWLLVCHKRFHEAGGRMIVHSIPAVAMNVLRLMRLNEVLEIAKRQEDAISLLSSEEASA